MNKYKVIQEERININDNLHCRDWKDFIKILYVQELFKLFTVFSKFQYGCRSKINKFQSEIWSLALA